MLMSDESPLIKTP